MTPTRGRLAAGWLAGAGAAGDRGTVGAGGGGATPRRCARRAAARASGRKRNGDAGVAAGALGAVARRGGVACGLAVPAAGLWPASAPYAAPRCDGSGAAGPARAPRRFQAQWHARAAAEPGAAGAAITDGALVGGGRPAHPSGGRGGLPDGHFHAHGLDRPRRLHACRWRARLARRRERRTLWRFRRRARAAQQPAKSEPWGGSRRRLRCGGPRRGSRTGRLDARGRSRLGSDRRIASRLRSRVLCDRPLDCRSGRRVGLRPRRRIRRTGAAHRCRPRSRRGAKRLAGLRRLSPRLGGGRPGRRLGRLRRRRRRAQPRGGAAPSGRTPAA